MILAMVSPEETLAQTVEKVIGYADSLSQESLGRRTLAVPLFNFDVIRRYSELLGKTLQIENPAYRDWPLEDAKQNIRFQLDERGAVLRSRAVLCVKAGGSLENCIFNEPFLLMLRYEDSPQPYFAMWVDNAEILVKAK